MRAIRPNWLRLAKASCALVFAATFVAPAQGQFNFADDILRLGSNANDGNQENEMSPALRKARDDFFNIVKGPDGRAKMPVDIYPSQRPQKYFRPDQLGLTAEGNGRLRVVQEGSSQSPTVFRVNCVGFDQAVESQQKDTWCWAAAVRINEHYMFGNASLPSQEEIVRRIHPVAQQDETAVSMQIVRALGDQDLAASMAPGEFAATLDTTVKLLADDRGNLNFVEMLREFLNQRMGVKEAVESVARGEPVLVSFREESYRHIYVLYAIDFIRIEKLRSDEFTLQTARTALETLQSTEEERKKNNEKKNKKNKNKGFKLPGWLQRNDKDKSEPNAVATLIGSGEYYAGVTFHMFDPAMHKQGQPSRFQSFDAAQFKDRLFFMINRTKANEILQDANEAVDRDLAQVGQTR